MRFYFIRHGESEANILHEMSNRGWKHGLTEKGREQAAALAHNLHSLDSLKAHKILSSPLMRAVQTAEIVAAALGLEVEVTDALREFDCGIAEGHADEAHWALWRWVMDEWLERGRADSRIPEGESLTDIHARFFPLMARLVAEKQNDDEAVILIGHGGLYLTVLPTLLPEVGLRFAGQFPNTGYVVAETQGDTFVCREWCGTPMPF